MRAIIAKSKCFQINYAGYAIHTFNFLCAMKKSKELGFERKSKKTVLNNLKTPAPQPLKAPISLPLPIWQLEDNCCPVEWSDKLESRCFVDLICEYREDGGYVFYL
jgi:hypothetical protein